MPISVTVEERKAGMLSWLAGGWEPLLCDYHVTGYTAHTLRAECGAVREVFSRVTGYQTDDNTRRIAPRYLPLVEAAIKAKEAIHG